LAISIYLLLGTKAAKKTIEFVRHLFNQEKKRNIDVKEFIDDYNDLQDDSKASKEERDTKYKNLVNSYYELATLFYEWGWGTSFHFANKYKGESFTESIKRHEYYLAGRLGCKKDDKLLDCGCGVGGPYRNIAKFTNCDITGITINEHQVQRGNQLNRQAGLQDICRSIQGDFMHLPFEDNSFDGVYAIEATCHAPDRVKVFTEIKRVLKPGNIFACYEWCLTDKYNKNNEEHKLIKKQIEVGDGLPDMATTWEVNKALIDSGFEIIECRDLAADITDEDEPWYIPLTPSYNVLSQRFQFTKIGMFLTAHLLSALEFLRLVPKGTNKVQRMLQQGALGCGGGGVTGTFTPMYLCVARKPLDT